MARSGPIPKRSEARTRRNKEGEDGIALKKGLALPYHWPEPDEDWHPWVVDFYGSFKESGMQAYYQTTDVAALQLACRLINREVVSKGRPSAMFLAECLKMVDGLGITEGERRRIKIELDTPTVQDVDQRAVDLAAARARLRAAAEK